MILNCIVVDDEPLARRQIEQYIEQTDFLNLAGSARNPLIAQAILQTAPVDLVFMDIKMPHISGIDFLKQQNISQQVIIISAYPEFAIEGFELSVTDYLVKPVSYERFYKAAEKALVKLSGNSFVKTNAEQPNFIYIKANQRLEKLATDDILFIQAMLNYVTIVTLGHKYIVYSSLFAIAATLT